MRVFRYLGALLALLGAPAAAQEQADDFSWHLNGRPVEGDRSEATRDGFGAMMMITPDVEQFWAAWAGPSPPQLVTTDRAVRNRPVHAMLIFTGCRAGADGNCDVDAAFTILAPDGSRYGEVLRGKVWEGPPPPGRNLQLSVGSVALRVEPHDPLGTYTIRAELTDRVAGTSVSVEREVLAMEAEEEPAAAQ